MPLDKGNSDHIVPLALGGRNGFEVWSDLNYNSDVGAHVDGAMHKDPLLGFALRNSDVVGHSNKKKVPVWKRSEVHGRLVQISFGEEEIFGWDSKARVPIPGSDLEGKTIKSTFKVERFTGLRFVAKVALGAGYHLYGDTFRQALDCDALRRTIKLTPKSKPEDAPATLTVMDRFHPDSTNTTAGMLHRRLCEFTDRSTVIVELYKDAIGFHVGLVGCYIGSIISPAGAQRLAKDADDLGKAVLLAPGSFEIIPFKDLCRRYLDDAETNSQAAAAGPSNDPSSKVDEPESQ